jgi:hypothetical protein
MRDLIWESLAQSHWEISTSLIEGRTLINDQNFLDSSVQDWFNKCKHVLGTESWLWACYPARINMIGMWWPPLFLRILKSQHLYFSRRTASPWFRYQWSENIQQWRHAVRNVLIKTRLCPLFKGCVWVHYYDLYLAIFR